MENKTQNKTVSNKNQELVTVVNKILASEYVLYTKTQKYHWNVVSPSFYEIHTFLEKQYQELAIIIDEVAEKVRSLEGVALGTLKEFLEHSKVQEVPGGYPIDKEMLRILLADHSILCKELEAGIETSEEMKSPSTADFLTQLLEKHEKMAWMLRSFLG